MARTAARLTRALRQTYNDALREARGTALDMGRAQLDALAAAFRQAARDVERSAAAGEMSEVRALRLRTQLTASLARLQASITANIDTTSEGIVREVLAAQRDVHAVMFGMAGTADDAETARLVSSFDVLADRAAFALAARRGAPIRTLLTRHVADAQADLDTLLSAGVAQGVSERQMTKDIAYLLTGGDPLVADREEVDLAIYALKDADVAGFRTLWSDARRLAVTETNNALRESNRLALVASPTVAAVQWTTSGNHGIVGFDECDVLATADLYGFGPGYYPPDAWPLAPHPYCACYQGEVQLRDPDEWDTERDPAPAIDGDVLDFMPDDLSDARAASMARTLRDVTSVMPG